MILARGFVIGAAVLIAGCGLSPIQKDQVASFSAATASVGGATAAQFAQLRQDAVEMNAERLMLDESQAPFQFKFDEPLGAAQITQRVLAVNALQSYGDTLNKLATSDQSADIKQSSTDLVSNFNAASAANLTSAQETAATDIIASLGGFFVEYQKKKAVEQIVSSYACPVDQLAALLERDFLNFGAGGGDPTRDHASQSPIAGCPFHSPRGDPAVGVLYGYEAAAGRLKDIAGGVLARKEPFEKRKEATQAMLLAMRNLDKGKAVGRDATAALQAMRKANAALVGALKGNQLKVQDIKAYGDAAKQLLASLRILAHQ